MRVLNEGEPLNIVRVFNNISLPDDTNSEFEKISQVMFQDGEIDYLGKTETFKIDEFCVGKCLGKNIYEYNVNTLKLKQVIFKDFSFIISFYIVERPLHNKQLYGLFNQIEGEEIYLKKKDLKTMKKARKTLRLIYELYNLKRDETISREPNMNSEKAKLKVLGKNIYNIS